MNADIYYDEMGKDMRVEEIPEDMMELAEEYREKLLDAVADVRRRDHGDVSWRARRLPIDEIRAAIRKATVAVEMVPVVCGTSYRNKGVQKLLDAIVDYMPVADRYPRHRGYQPEDGRRRRASCRATTSLSPPWHSRS